ncbi:MAG: cytochrome P460 family protein [Planctomycetes bacterium]|nr:cytochrome P460 family protein [Planctomycetota bacterium]
MATIRKRARAGPSGVRRPWCRGTISDQANFRLRRLDENGNITTICGSGVAGYTGDDGPPLLATIRSPIGQSAPPAGRIAIDAQDRIYIADTGNHVIRRIDADGKIRTIAGIGQAGYSGDGGPATAVKLNTPSDVVVAPDGTFYIADTNNHRIRRLQFKGPDFTDGQITTIAGTGVAGDSGDGGPAIEAQINYPQDLELGLDGKLYFADTDNDRVRRIDLQSGIIEGVAVTGERGYSGDGGSAMAARFNRPFGIAFDPFGNLYISDTFNSRIRKVKLTSTPEGPEPILPADYRSSYVEVRNCRFSLEHGGVYIRVLASPEAALKYLENANPLPVGSVIVKEEYSDDHCEASELLRWRVMGKESPGFDPADGDWHWQWLTSRCEVVYDDKKTCIGCHLQSDCVRRDYMCTLPGGGAEMKAGPRPSAATS